MRPQRTYRFGTAAILTGCCLLCAAIINWMVLSGALDRATEMDASVILATPRSKTRFHPDAMHPSMRYIPKIIHVAVGSRKPGQYLDDLRSWQDLNLGWEIRLYNDSSVTAYVRTHFPQYYPTFRSLGKLVEKADMFRYLVLLGEGGVYTDADVECLRPLDEYMPSMGAGLVVGWERDGVPPNKCAEWQYARTRQLLPWTMASVSGHPALERMVQSIVKYRNVTLHNHPIRDTLERTGPAAFTDVVLRYMKEHPPSQTTGWPVTLLPTVVWGYVDDSNAATSGWMRAIEHQPSAAFKRPGAHEGFGTCLVAPPGAMWPVTIPWSSPFHVMVHLPWEGSREAGGNPSLRVSRHGSWQPGLKATDTPSPLDVLSLLMRQVQENTKTHGSLMDIGAGYGLHSLAMAAQGYKVVAFSRPNERAYSAFERSIQYNGFDDAISLYPVQLAQTVLVEKPQPKRVLPRKRTRRRTLLAQQQAGSGSLASEQLLEADMLQQQTDRQTQRHLLQADRWSDMQGSQSVGQTDGQTQRHLLQADQWLQMQGMTSIHKDGIAAADQALANGKRTVGTDSEEDSEPVMPAVDQGSFTDAISDGGLTDFDQGMGWTEKGTERALHQVAAEAMWARDTPNSAWMLTQRTAMDSLHAVLRAQYNLPPVAVVRVNANGWEPLLLDSVLGVLSQPPMAIMMLWDVMNMGQQNGGMEPRDVMNRLLSMGYDRVLEAVKGCCSNTSNASQLSALVAQEAIALGPEQATLSWCDISSARVSKLLEIPKDNLHKKPGIRNVVFLHRSNPLASPATSTMALQQCYAANARRVTPRDRRTRGGSELLDRQTDDGDAGPPRELILPKYEQVQPKNPHELGQLVKGVGS